MQKSKISCWLFFFSWSAYDFRTFLHTLIRTILKTLFTFYTEKMFTTSFHPHPLNIEKKRFEIYLLFVCDSNTLRINKTDIKLKNCFTLRKVQKIHVILGRSENTFHLLQWLSIGKKILKHKKKKTHITKIILHNCILYNGDLTYAGTFSANLRMALIFTDFSTESGSSAHALLEICKYQRHPSVNWKSSNVGQVIIIFNIIVQYYFVIYVFFIFLILQILSSHRHPL